MGRAGEPKHQPVCLFSSSLKNVFYTERQFLLSLAGSRNKNYLLFSPIPTHEESTDIPWVVGSTVYISGLRVFTVAYQCESWSLKCQYYNPRKALVWTFGIHSSFELGDLEMCSQTTSYLGFRNSFFLWIIKFMSMPSLIFLSYSFCILS